MKIYSGEMKKRKHKNKGKELTMFFYRNAALPSIIFLQLFASKCKSSFVLVNLIFLVPLALPEKLASRTRKWIWINQLLKNSEYYMKIIRAEALLL